MVLKFIIILSFFTLSACKDDQTGRSFLIVGDSWATMICNYKSLDQSLVKVGITNVKAKNSCLTTTRVGIRADAWKDSIYHKLTRAMIADPQIEVLYLSLGGNDIMNYWNKFLTPAEEQIMFDKVISDVQSVISEYQKIRPDLKILLSGYDFPRFYLNHPIPEYSDAFEAMGRPTPFEINSAVVRFSDRVSRIANQRNVFYIQHYGISHYHFGHSDSGLRPFATLSPELISSPQNISMTGGNLNLQSDPAAMLKIRIGNNEIIDAFHLNRDGFEKVADHVVLHYFRNWLQK